MNNNPRPTEIFCVATIILLSAFITVVNLGFQLTLAGSDYGLNYVFPDIWLHLAYNTWDDLTSTGKPGLISSMTLVWSTIIGLLGYWGFSDIFISRLVFFSFFTLSGLGVFSLCKTLFAVHTDISNKKDIYIGCLSGSLLYMFSIYVTAFINTPIYNYHFVIPLFPIFWNLIILNLNKRATFTGIILTSLVLLLLLNANPSHILLIFLVIFFYVIFYQKEILKEKKNFYKFITGVFFLTVLLTAHFWIPIAGFIIGTEGTNPYGEVGSQWSSLVYNSRRGQMSNLLLGRGYPYLDGFEYFRSYDENIVFRIASLILIFIVVSTFFFRSNLKIKTFLGCLLIVFLFFSKGYQPPFAQVIRFFHEFVPGFGMFRAVNHKFGLIVSLSSAVLVSFTITEVLSSTRKLRENISRAIAVSAFLIVVILNGYPVFSGKAVESTYKSIVPKDYMELRKTYENIKIEAKTLCLPATIRGSGSVLVWDSGYQYLGPHIAFYTMASPYIDAAWFIKKKFFQLEENDWFQGTGIEKKITEILNYSSSLGVKFIFLQKDSPDEYIFSGKIRLIMNARKKAEMLEFSLKKLEKLGKVKLIQNKKNYSIYQIQEKWFLPNLYIASKIGLVSS